jgi:hypothetical protein
MAHEFSKDQIYGKFSFEEKRELGSIPGIGGLDLIVLKLIGRIAILNPN